MPRPGLLPLNRPVMLALAIVVWLALPIGARSAQAAGCHVPDRPVLGADASGRPGRHIPAWAMAEGVPIAPPVLTRVPCPGETPHPGSASMPILKAARPAAVPMVAESASRAIHAVEDIERLDPHPFRLDRPPR